MALIATLVVVAAGYLIGSIPFAVVVTRAMGLADPRSYGSGNPGATNVLRSGSRVAALLTLLGDAAKGAVAVWLARRFGAAYGVADFGVALAGLAAFIGHLYPVFLKFRGGKGVATFLGVLLALTPWIGLVACVAWLLVAVFFRYSSLASLSAAAVAPFAQAFAERIDGTVLAIAAMSVLLAFRHKQNIANLMAGKEGRIGQKGTTGPAHKAPH